MGNDNALICKIFGSQQTVEHAFNSGRSQPNVLSVKNPSVGLSNIKVQLEDNKLVHLIDKNLYQILEIILIQTQVITFY